jgi:hypothetical protein
MRTVTTTRRTDTTTMTMEAWMTEEGTMEEILAETSKRDYTGLYVWRCLFIHVGLIMYLDNVLHHLNGAFLVR